MSNNALNQSPPPSRGRVREGIETLKEFLCFELPPSPALPPVGERELEQQHHVKVGGCTLKLNKGFKKYTPPLLNDVSLTQATSC